MPNTDPIYIEQMSEILDRKVHTIRQWIREKALPSELEPDREGGRQKIFWVEAQVDGLKTFAAERSARRGWQHAQA